LSNTDIHSNSLNNSDSTDVSVKYLRQIFWMRFVLFAAIVWSLDFGDSQIVKDENDYSKEWGVNFIAKNELESAVQKEPVSPSLFVKNNLTLLQKEEVSPIKKTTVTKYKLAVLVNPLKVSEPLMNRSKQRVVKLGIKRNAIQKIAEVETYIYPEKIISNSYYAATIKADGQSGAHNLIQNSEWVSDKNWYVYGLIGPQYSEGKVWQPSNESYENVSGITDLVTNSGGESTSNYKQSFGCYLGIGYSLNKHWDLVSGLKYSQRNGSQTAYYDSEYLRKQTITTSVATNNTDGTKSFSNQAEVIEYVNYFSDTVVLNYRLSNIEIPLMVRYNFGVKKWNYFINSGISVKVRSQYSSRYISNQIGSGTISENQMLGSSFNGLIGFGAEYFVTENIAIQLSPQFAKGLVNISTDGGQRKSYSAGVFAGLRYTIK
jgi:hypothetical protein